MNQLQAMRVFTRVVDLASFNLAARQLGMSAAAVTRSVSMLEAHLNMRLLNRTTRSLSLTEVGKEYLDGCRTIIEKLDEMESNLVQTTRDPRGTLRIATPMTFATSGLGNLLASYRTLHPRIPRSARCRRRPSASHDDSVRPGRAACRGEPDTTAKRP
jgi:DNA-binding transcriptional LysR family regulator